MNKKIVEFALDRIGEEICRVNIEEVPNYHLITSMLHIIRIDILGDDNE
jgi:hypothetical protein